MEHSVALGSELTGRLQHQKSELANACGFDVAKLDKFLKDGEKISCCFTTASYRVSQHIVTIEDGGDYFPLDDSWVFVVEVESGLGQRLANEQLVERD